MERFTRRENVLLGYNSPQRSFENPSSSSEANSDVDFHDVFGGPPRRASLHEGRYSSGRARNSEDTVLSRSSLSGLNEIPVFGEENVNRRRYPSDDFFDDIFRRDDSVGSPRRSDKDPSCSTPGSRVSSPVRSLAPRADPFATSLPAQFRFLF